MNSLNSQQEAQLKKLLQIKRYETPGQAYFDAFVGEFHHYQRSGLMQERQSFSLRIQRMYQDLQEAFQVRLSSIPLWIPSAALSCLILAGLLAANVLNSGSTTQIAQQTAAAVEPSKVFVDGTESQTHPTSHQAELTMAHLTSFDKDFEGSQYVTGEQSLPYDALIAF
ncbi:MAG: hypothetical protein ACFCUX_03950 [Candidatus Methylacidiphilales bacterium]